MGLIELLVLAVGLSMDAFAVSVCKGLQMRKINYNQTAVIGLFFGGFQALMPVIGWAIGKSFEKYIVEIDHWIAFCLLGVLGVKMIYEAVKGEEDSCGCWSIKELFFLAIATSIDALAVGITFAFLKVNVLPAVSIIGVITFAFSVAGVWIGNKFGAKFESKAEIAGGIILILIGTKILLEHLNVINF